MSQVGQLIMESTQIIFQRYHQRNQTKALVQEMIKLQAKVSELKQETIQSLEQNMKDDIAKHLKNA